MSFNISTAGTYCVAIQDGWTTKACAFFKVGDSTVEIKAKSISATPNALEAGVATDVTLNVSGLSFSTKYLVRLYSASSGYSSENDGFGESGIVFDDNYTQYTDITTDSGGNATATYSMNVAKAGTYALCVMTTSYGTVARVFITVTSDEYLSKYVFAESENSEIDVLWDNIPDTVGWAGIYPKGYTDVYTYGDYIYPSNASFPSGDSSRYKAFTWPLAVGEYTVVFFSGTGYDVYKSVDIEVKKFDVTLTPDAYELGKGEAMSLSVEGGLDAGKTYAIRLYKASGSESGFGNSGIDWNSKVAEYGNVTADENGLISANVSTHLSSITEAGTYAYTIMDVADNYNTVARAFFTVTEPEKVVIYDLQSYVGSVTVTNDTTKETLLADLQALSLPEGVSVTAITEFYNLKAFEGVIEQGSTYEGAENYNGKILVPGVDGAVGATVSVNTPDGAATAVISIVIEAPMATRGYASMSNPEPNPANNPDWSWASYNARWEYHPESGYAAEKILIPNEITELKNDWHYGWEANNPEGITHASVIKCVVFPENLEVVPYNGGINPEVISFAGNKVTTLGSYTNTYNEYFGTFRGLTNLKYIRLPDSLKTICKEAFAYCSSLEQFYIPENVETIGGSLFIRSDDSWTKSLHKLTQVTIPANVQSVGSSAFYTPASAVEYTVLSNSSSISSLAFVAKWKAGNIINQRVVVRGFSGSKVLTYTNGDCTVLPTLKTLEETMTLAEAAARVAGKVATLKGTDFTDTATVTEQLTDAYGSVSGIELTFKNDEWLYADGVQYNIAVLTKGGITAEVKVSFTGKTSFYADGASILTTDAFTANGNKQGLRFYNAFESSSANKVMIKGVEYDIVEFGVVLKHIGTDATSTKNNTVADSEFVIGAKGVTQIVGKENTIQTADGVNFYTVYIKNIPKAGRNYSFQCRGYIKYQDGDTVKIIYTDSQVKSISDVFNANSSAAEYSGMADWFAGN